MDEMRDLEPERPVCVACTGPLTDEDVEHDEDMCVACVTPPTIAELDAYLRARGIPPVKTTPGLFWNPNWIYRG